jgi:type I restriction enzyme S subunit
MTLSAKAWRSVPLGQIADVRLGKMLDKVKHLKGRRLPYLRNVNVRWGTVETDDLREMYFEDDELERYGLRAGDVLVCEGGEPGRASVWDGRLPGLKYQKAIHRVRFNEAFEPRLLVYQLEHIAKSGGLERRFTGSTIKHLTGEAFVQLPVLVPPLAEQRLLVGEIEKQLTRLEAGMVALRRVQANLKRYRAAVLKAACEGRLVPTEAELARKENRSYETGEQLLTRMLAERRRSWINGKYREPASADTRSLATLPDGWACVSIEQMIVEPLCNGVSIKGSDTPPGVRALRLSAMSDSGFDYSDARFLPLADEDVDDLWIRGGDFFIARGNGSLHLVGRGTEAQDPPRKTIFPDTMIRLRLCEDAQKTHWVSTVWPSRVVRAQIERKVKTTAGIYKIAQPQVAQIVIPLPPFAEQLRIVAEVERRLSVIDELQTVVMANLQRATRLRQSILERALSGRLISNDASPK